MRKRKKTKRKSNIGIPIVTTIRNRFTTFDWDTFEAEELRPYFSYLVPGYWWNPKFKQGVWDGRISLLKRNTVATGIFLKMLPQMQKDGIPFDLTDDRVSVSFKHEDPSRIEIPGKKLRQYQLDCIAEMLLQSDTGGLVLNATGTGKTMTAAAYLSLLEGSAVFVVDELTLLEQAKEEFEEVLGETVGVVGKSVFDPKRITVATIQTLHLHRMEAAYKSWTNDLQVMIIDEIHVGLNARQKDTIAAIQPPVVFGLTATLEIEKEDIAMRAAAMAGPVIFRYEYQDGVQEQHLTPAVVIGADLVRTHQCAEDLDYHGLYRKYIVSSRQRNDFLEDLLREGLDRGKYIILLVERVKHLEKLSKRMEDVPHRVVFGDKKVADRIAAKEDFESGKVRLLLVNKVFKKGVNLKRTDVIIDAAGMYGANDAVQKLGRGVRLCDAKSGLIYFDVGDRRPAGEPLKSNRLLKSTENRRKALRKLGVTVKIRKASIGAAELYALAERQLKRVLRTGKLNPEKLL
jgi:superfamily II DNA or RNA helicase